VNAWAFVVEYIRNRHFPVRTRERLLARQSRMVLRHLRWVLSNSPFTAERFGGKDASDWRTISTIGKSEMMANFDQLNTAGVSLEQAMKLAKADEESREFSAEIQGLTVGLSSGTSGKLGLFVASLREQAQWAGSILAKVIPRHIISLRRDRVAFFLRANNSLYERTASRRIRFEFFDLFDELESQLDRLRLLQPTIVVAPPSLLRQLAERVESGEVSLAPERIISVAEPLDPIDEMRFEVVFGQKIHQVYQATEGLLGTTCSRGTLHLNEETIIFEREYLDDHRFVPIITDYRRRTQPIIRYRLDDVLHLRKEPCPCGSPCTAISSVEGRVGDILQGQREGESPREIFADFIRRRVLMSAPTLSDYGVRQIAPNELELYLLPETVETREAVSSGLKELYLELGCSTPKITRVDTWPQGGLAKRRRVIRDL